MTDENDPGLRPPSDTSLNGIEKTAAQAALRLVNFDKEPHDKVLDGIIEMSAHYSPSEEEDISIARLEKGLFVLSDMRNFRVTRIETYIGSYLGQAFGSAEAISSEPAKLEIARMYSSVVLLRQAFESAFSGAGELDQSKLRDFMMRSAPSKFWQNQSTAKVGLNNTIESFEVANHLAAGLEIPVSVEGLMKQIEDALRIQGLGIADLPPEATEIDKKRKENELIYLTEKAWEEWRVEAHHTNLPTDHHDLNS